MNIKRIDTLLRALLSALLFKAVALCKLSLIVGPKIAFFSASNIFYPIAGKMLGRKTSVLAFGIFACVKLFFGVPCSLLFVYGFPGLCAALYMTLENRMARIFIPVLCMILFVAHPVGYYAVPYTFYWLIPIVLHYVKKESFFKEALGATFVAHAVGSVAWLYLTAMPAQYWWALIPVVAVERLLFASGATILFYALNKVKNFAETTVADMKPVLIPEIKITVHKH